MQTCDRQSIESFLDRWHHSGDNERANYQMFFAELCDAFGIERPQVKGKMAGDLFCFDKDVKIIHPDGKETPGFIDLYKEGCFVLEAKQGGTQTGKGTAKRGTNSYRKAMKAAYIQALNYGRALSVKPPFIMTCDIGDHFEVWQDFSESWLGTKANYGEYDARRVIDLDELRKEEVCDWLVRVFTEPQSLNPEKIAAQVTREVAADLAELAKKMENTADPQAVAHFLMRCIFTMFAEDVGLLKEQLFTQALESRWLKDPGRFKPEVEALWKAMNEGTDFGFSGRLLRFDGGLFAESAAFELTADQLQILLQAAKRDWRNVEPAIFGTLLERALDPRERSKLGAHYTPRSYVERLVRPVILEPLQDRWQLVQGEVEQVLGDGEPTKTQVTKVSGILEGFLRELREIRVLDPACGSGNFLYVTLDLLKTLEQEVLNYLGAVTRQDQLRLDFEQVSPAQFLGIELNPRAAAIADLVIWIGYLQWHFRRFGNIPPLEPVLREYKNIECRDAVLAYDGRKPAIDGVTGEVRTRWGGRMMRHPVTGQEVPDPSDRVVIYDYINPRPAIWQEADYIVSNPPFIGTKRLKETLDDNYIDALRKVYLKLPETIDYVMYWWYKSGLLTCLNRVKGFGLITTNSLCQVENRKIIQEFISDPLFYLSLAISDHPWTDEGASVRISMTGAKKGNGKGRLGKIVEESKCKTPEDSANALQIKWTLGHILEDLRIGADIAKATPLISNLGLCNQGCKLVQRRRQKGEDWEQGFLLRYETARNIGFDNRTNEIIKSYITGDDITGKSRQSFVIDFYGLSREEAEAIHPKAYQRVLEQVKPFRDQNSMKRRREFWWIFGAPASRMRESIGGLSRYIATSEVAKHRVFIFVDSKSLADGSCFAFGFSDAYFLGVISSIIHVTWVLATGGTLENRPRYNNTVCFDPFPFPDPPEDLKQTIRDLGERLDRHRKNVQFQHPEITITGMYNLLEKMRKNEPFTDQDREYNNKALVSTLKQIHDDLDQATYHAYGWQDLIPLSHQPDPKEHLEQQILERLVALNAQRAEEERNGHIRWLRPDYQAPKQTSQQTQITGIDTETPDAIIPPEQQKFPTAFKDQLAAVRDLLRTQGGEWTIPQIAAQYKGKKATTAITQCLDILQELGLILSYPENNITHYHAAELQKIASA